MCIRDRYWIHNGYINIDNKKMSKSLGNFFTVRDISKQFDLEVVRLFMLSAHYRSPVNFSKELLEQAKNSLERLYNARDNALHLMENSMEKKLEKEEINWIEKLGKYREAFKNSMEDDLNTADALAAIFDLVKEMNIYLDDDKSRETIKKAYDLFLELTNVLGIVQKTQEKELDKEIEELIEKRQQARREKNWTLADEIRDQLTEKGIIIEDTPQGVKWKRV